MNAITTSSSISSSAATKKLEDQLTCPVCLDQYIDPRTLPCLHSFCTKCLEEIPLDDSHKLSCPTCRTPVDLSQQGVSALPKAFHLNNLIEVQILLKKSSGNMKTVCENCPNGDATVYCLECGKFICQFCSDVHKRWSSLSSHKIMSIREVSSNASQMVSNKPPPAMNCSTHSKPLDLYCVTCEQPICYYCTIKGHKGHTHDLIDDAYEDSKKIILERVQSVEEEIKKEKFKKNELQQSKEDIQKKGRALKSKINNLCDQFVQKIEEARLLGLSSVDAGVTAYSKCEDQRIKEVNSKLEALENCTEVVERSMQMDTPTQLLASKKQVMTRIEELIGPPIPKKKENVFTEITFIEREEILIEPTYENTYELPMPDEKEISEPIHDTNNESLQFDEDMTVDVLKKRILSILPLQYPEEAFEECECKAKFPEAIETKTASKGTFALSYQGQPMVVATNKITCSFSHEFLNDQLSCGVNLIDENGVMKYQITFTTSRHTGMYELVLKIGDIGVKTTDVLNVIDPKGRAKPELVLVNMPHPPLPKFTFGHGPSQNFTVNLKPIQPFKCPQPTNRRSRAVIEERLTYRN